MLKPNEVTRTADSASFLEADVRTAPRLLVLFDRGQERVVQVVADVLGLSPVVAGSAREVGDWSSDPAIVIGLENGPFISGGLEFEGAGRTIINTHAMDLGAFSYTPTKSFYDFEFIYTASELVRREVARFLGFVLGQVRPHETLCTRQRTAMLSISVADVRDVMPNMDIVTIGADAVEFRVDLLKDDLPGKAVGGLPSIKTVGEQLMLLRRATDLPIVFTVRSTSKNGRLQVHDPALVLSYLRKAIQWGVEYVDVELSLPESARRALADEKRNSKIITTFSDLSGEFCWGSEEAYQLYKDSAAYGDIVKMMALTDSAEEDHELESFRANVQAQHPCIPFCGLNLSAASQVSSTMNRVLTPVTHPLMPSNYSETATTIAEIHTKLQSTEQLNPIELYAVGEDASADGTLHFMQKYFNEIGLPHQLRGIDQISPKLLQTLSRSYGNLSGAYLSPPMEISCLEPQNVTAAAAQIGQIDTLLPGTSLHGDNTFSKAIKSILTESLTPSAFKNKTTLIIGDQSSHATVQAALSALKSLQTGAVYCIGFKPTGHPQLMENVHYVAGIEDLMFADKQLPFVVVSALPAHRAVSVAPLLKLFDAQYQQQRQQHGSKSMCGGRCFLDLSGACAEDARALGVAKRTGWEVAGGRDVRAWWVVEFVKGVIGRSVGVEVVKRWL